MGTVSLKEGLFQPVYTLHKVSLSGEGSRRWMSALMVSADFLALFLMGACSVTVRIMLEPNLIRLSEYSSLLPLIALFIVIYKVFNLYPGSRLGPVEELRRLTVSTSLSFLLLATVTFWAQTSMSYSRLIYTSTWMLALAAVPALRWIVRTVAIRAGLWGEPTAVIGSGPETRKLVERLRSNAEIGLRPEVMIDRLEGVDLDDSSERRQTTRGFVDLFRNNHIDTAILVLNEVPQKIRTYFVDENDFGLHHVILIPDVGYSVSSLTLAYDFQKGLGLELQRNLLSRPLKIFKRLLDLLLVLIGGIFLLPVIGLISLAVAIDSKGPVFYSHKRVGLGGKPIHVWKFRTMVPDAEEVLEKLLASSPKMRLEWDAQHKLQDDPRVTVTGHFLRRTSLDELPQVWNVIKGEMSLVGPRPIVEDEIRHYQKAFRLYCQVLPGISGLWQVSGRSATTYAARVQLDEYYIRNWSIWLDIHILLKTILAVLTAHGAC